MSIADASTVTLAASAWLGTPYHHQASLCGAGCDCLGLIRGVWRDVAGPEPMALPAYTRDWGEVGRREVLLEALRGVMRPGDGIVPGAVLAFRMMPGALAKHAGIVLEPGLFVHAHERRGVTCEPLTTAWRRRVVGVFHYPAGEAR